MLILSRLGRMRTIARTIFLTKHYQCCRKDEGGDFGTPTMPQFLICPHKGLDYLEDVVWGPILRRIAGNGLRLDHLIAWVKW